MKIRLYLLDQGLFLFIGVCFLIWIKTNAGHIFSIIFQLLIFISWLFLCRHFILFPFDLLSKTKSEEVYFSKQSQFDRYEFFRNKYSCIWTFYNSHNKKFELLVPFSKSKEEILSIGHPENSKKIRITYYRFSKILHSWEYV